MLRQLMFLSPQLLLELIDFHLHMNIEIHWNTLIRVDFYDRCCQYIETLESQMS